MLMPTIHQWLWIMLLCRYTCQDFEVIDFKLPIETSYFAAAVYQNQLFVLNGQKIGGHGADVWATPIDLSNSNSWIAYDTFNDNITEICTGSQIWFTGQSFIQLKSSIYGVPGYYNATWERKNDILFQYSMSSGSYQSLCDKTKLLPIAVTTPCIASINDLLYIIGGSAEYRDENMTYVQIYDTLSNTFSMGTLMDKGRYSHGCASVDNNYIYVFGGVTPETYPSLTADDSVSKYDIVLDEWKPLNTKLSFGRWESQCIYDYIYQLIYCIGGSGTGGSTPISLIDIFDVQNEVIISNVYNINLQILKTDMTSIMIYNDYLLVMGGIKWVGGGGNPDDDIELMWLNEIDIDTNRTRYPTVSNYDPITRDPTPSNYITGAPTPYTSYPTIAGYTSSTSITSTSNTADIDSKSDNVAFTNGVLLVFYALPIVLVTTIFYIFCNREKWTHKCVRTSIKILLILIIIDVIILISGSIENPHYWSDTTYGILTYVILAYTFVLSGVVCWLCKGNRCGELEEIKNRTHNPRYVHHANKYFNVFITSPESEEENNNEPKQRIELQTDRTSTNKQNQTAGYIPKYNDVETKPSAPTVDDDNDNKDIIKKTDTLVSVDYADNECCVCMDNRKEWVCTPCGHYCLCENCKDKINGKCPICQQKCDFMKIFG